MRMELGFERWEAMGHFLIEADYLAFHRSDYRGAIAQCEEAWKLLSTPWQQRTGADILEGIADYALRSEDPDLANEILGSLRPRAAQIAAHSLQKACARLGQLAGEREQD
jgi:hypothetical protein